MSSWTNEVKAFGATSETGSASLSPVSVMPAKAGIQVRNSAHGREEAMVRTMRG